MNGLKTTDPNILVIDIISLQEQDQSLSPPHEDLLLALGACLGIRLSHPHFHTLLGPHFLAAFN